MSEFDCEKLFKTNKDIALNEFNKFKLQNGLPVGAKIEDVTCQRLLKTRKTRTGNEFKEYYGLSIIIPLPSDISNAIFDFSKKIVNMLGAIGLNDSFIFIPKNTYHITVMGIVERVGLSVTESEIQCYSRMINKANNSLNKSTPIIVSIERVEYYDDFMLYLRVKLDREPVNTIELLNQEFGNSVLYTDGYHITIAYQLTTLSCEQRAKIAGIVGELSEKLVGSIEAFQITKAKLSVFKSMSNYRIITDAVIELS